MMAPLSFLSFFLLSGANSKGYVLGSQFGVENYGLLGNGCGFV